MRRSFITQHRTILLAASLLLAVSVFSQTLFQRLSAPVFFTGGIQPTYHSNPLNLSEREIEIAANDSEYLGGIAFVSSRVLSVDAALKWAPRIWNGRKSEFSTQIYHHHYFDIRERTYLTWSLRLTQSLGNYRYFSAGYWLLPEYYLRHYNFQDPSSGLYDRKNCSFGTDRLWLGLEHRITKKNRIEYRLNRRQELYQAPFSSYDMQMNELDIILKSRQWKPVSFNFEFQYGESRNVNALDEKDRSYRYLNLRPTFWLKLPAKQSLKIGGRYDQRVYESDQHEDPLHAGRFQDELRLDLSWRIPYGEQMELEPFFTYRERRVDASEEEIAELKSFTRYWFGISMSFDSVIDMYF